MTLEFTGERFVPLSPACTASIAYEHWHRYAYAARLVAGKSVLDVASGEGYGSRLLAEHASSVVGVDIDPVAIAHARATHRRDNLQFQEGSAAAIPIAGEKVFDVIVSFETIEHIDEAAQVAFLGEVRRLLKDDGLFVVSSPDKATYTDASSFVNEFHLKEFYCDEFRQFLSRWFVHVSLVGQALHGVSYLHRLDRGEGPFVQFVLPAADGATPAPTHVYLIAVCSNSAPVETPFSVLLDAKENLHKEAHLARMQLKDREAQLQRVQGVLAEREAELGSIKATLSYRVYDGVRSGMRFAAGRIRGRKP
jgi:O-antigen biosynthesis protein